MVHVGGVFVASIHLSRTRMSGSSESVQWNTCVHRLDLGLYSYVKEFWGNGARNHVNSTENITSTGSSEEVWTGNAVSHRTGSPTRYQLSVQALGVNTSYPSCSWLLSPARPAVQNSVWQKNSHNRKYLIYLCLSNTVAWNFHIVLKKCLFYINVMFVFFLSVKLKSYDYAIVLEICLPHADWFLT